MSLHPPPLLFYLQLALWLAFFNQAFASTAIINYAPQVPHAIASFSCLQFKSSFQCSSKPSAPYCPPPADAAVIGSCWRALV